MKRILVFSLLLASVYSVYAQVVTCDDMERDPKGVMLHVRTAGLSSYQAVDGKVYSVGDVLIIGQPSKGDFFQPLYGYISGPKSFTNGESGISNAVINGFCFKKSNELQRYVMCVKAVAENMTIQVQLDEALMAKEILGKNDYLKPAVAAAQDQTVNNNQSFEPVLPAREKREKVVREKRERVVDDGPQRKGYGGVAYLSGGFDFANAGGFVNATVVNGYHFNSHIFVGGGIGIMYYGYTTISDYGSWDASPVVGMPIFAHGQYTFCHSQNKVRPYISMGLGAAIAFTTLDSGHAPHGFYFETAGGIQVKLKEKLNFDVALTFPMSVPHSSGFGLRVGCTF